MVEYTCRRRRRHRQQQTLFEHTHTHTASLTHIAHAHHINSVSHLASLYMWWTFLHLDNILSSAQFSSDSRLSTTRANKSVAKRTCGRSSTHQCLFFLSTIIVIIVRLIVVCATRKHTNRPKFILDTFAGDGCFITRTWIYTWTILCMINILTNVRKSALWCIVEKNINKRESFPHPERYQLSQKKLAAGKRKVFVAVPAVSRRCVHFDR